MKLPYWIREADCSRQDFEPVDYGTAVTAIRDEDWPAKLADFRRLAKAEETCCPPTVGFPRPTRPRAEFLQFCPAREGLWTVYYQHPDRRSEHRLLAEGATNGTIETALFAFYADDRAGIEATLERFVT